jgi:hypothetical protein
MCIDAVAPSGEAAAPDLADEIFGDDDDLTTGLDELLNHLLGGGTRILADAGLSRFCPQRLAAIQHGAEARVAEGLHGLQAMSQVLAVALEHPHEALPAPVLAGVAWHFHAQLHAMERWKELAANAAGLRGNRAAAADIARVYVAWARRVGEWPQAG